MDKNPIARVQSIIDPTQGRRHVLDAARLLIDDGKVVREESGCFLVR